MTWRQFCCQQFIAPVAEISAGDDGDFLPAVPINIAIFLEHRIKTGLVEGDIFPGMEKQLRELTALKCQHGFRRPELTFHKHFIDTLFEQACFVHARILAQP
jgi:hypothetical protein